MRLMVVKLPLFTRGADINWTYLKASPMTPQQTSGVSTEIALPANVGLWGQEQKWLAHARYDVIDPERPKRRQFSVAHNSTFRCDKLVDSDQGRT